MGVAMVRRFYESRMKESPDDLFRIIRAMFSYFPPDRHEITVEDIREYYEFLRCPHCGYVFKTKLDLESHRASLIFGGEITSESKGSPTFSIPDTEKD